MEDKAEESPEVETPAWASFGKAVTIGAIVVISAILVYDIATGFALFKDIGLMMLLAGYLSFFVADKLPGRDATIIPAGLALIVIGIIVVFASMFFAPPGPYDAASCTNLGQDIYICKYQNASSVISAENFTLAQKAAIDGLGMPVPKAYS